MTRPIFGKMKTIVLPVYGIALPTNLAGYKEQTGIDLTEVFDIEITKSGDDYIAGLRPKSHLASILIQGDGSYINDIAEINCSTNDDTTVSLGHAQFADDGTLAGGFGLVLSVDQDNPTLEGIGISLLEL